MFKSMNPNPQQEITHPTDASCHYCGGPAHVALDRFAPPVTCWMACPSCGATGPRSASIEEAKRKFAVWKGHTGADVIERAYCAENDPSTPDVARLKAELARANEAIELFKLLNGRNIDKDQQRLVVSDICETLQMTEVTKLKAELEAAQGDIRALLAGKDLNLDLAKKLIEERDEARRELERLQLTADSLVEQRDSLNSKLRDEEDEVEKARRQAAELAASILQLHVSHPWVDPAPSEWSLNQYLKSQLGPTLELLDRFEQMRAAVKVNIAFTGTRREPDWSKVVQQIEDCQSRYDKEISRLKELMQ